MAIEDLEALPYDEGGNLPRGDNGERVPPADPAETTAATQPSPDPVTPPAVVEDKSGAAPVEEKPGTITAKAPALDESKLTDDEVTALKEKHARPTDKGDEWQIRAAREGHKLRKQFEPVNDVMERIGSPDRARRGLELTAELADPEVPIANAWSKMTALSSSRATELHDHLYNETLDTYPDVVATDLVGEQATVTELKEGLKLLRAGAKTVQPQSGTTTAPNAEVQKPADMSDQDWQDFQLDYPEAFKALQAQAAAVKPAEPVKEPVHPAEAKLKELEDQKRTEWVNQKVQEIQVEGEKLHKEAYEVVDQGLRDLGLVPDPAKHDEKQVKLIERTSERIRSAVEAEFDGPDGPEGPQDYSRLSDEQKLNRKLVEKTIGLLAKGDFTSARDYLDRIRAQVDLAFQRAADPEIELYNAAMLQSTTPKPRDGNTHQRPELVGGTAPGGANSNKTPWLDPAFKQPNETNVQAMNRYLESSQGLPGR